MAYSPHVLDGVHPLVGMQCAHDENHDRNVDRSGREHVREPIRRGETPHVGIDVGRDERGVILRRVSDSDEMVKSDPP